MKFTLYFICCMALFGCMNLEVIRLPRADYLANVNSESVVQIDTSEGQQLTLMLRELLYPPEIKQLSAIYGLDNLDEKTTKEKKDISGAAYDITDFTLMHTDVWQEAILKGKLVETGLLVLGGAFFLDSMTSQRTPPKKVSGFYLNGFDENAGEEGMAALTDSLARKSVDVLVHHFESLGYELDGIIICDKDVDLVLKQSFQSRTLSNKGGCPKEKSIENVNIVKSVFYQFLFKISDNNDVRSMEYFWPNKVIAEVYYDTLQIKRSSIDNSFFVYSKPNEWQFNLYHSPSGLTEEAFSNYQAFRRNAGTDFYRAFHYTLTEKVPGYFSFYREIPNKKYHLAEGLYKGRLYRVKERLTEDASVIEGRIDEFKKNNIFIRDSELSANKDIFY